MSPGPDASGSAVPLTAVRLFRRVLLFLTVFGSCDDLAINGHCHGGGSLDSGRGRWTHDSNRRYLDPTWLAVSFGTGCPHWTPRHVGSPTQAHFHHAESPTAEQLSTVTAARGSGPVKVELMNEELVFLVNLGGGSHADNQELSTASPTNQAAREAGRASKGRARRTGAATSGRAAKPLRRRGTRKKAENASSQRRVWAHQRLPSWFIRRLLVLHVPQGFRVALTREDDVVGILRWLPKRAVGTRTSVT